MSITFNPISRKLIDLGYIPLDDLDKKKYPWKDKYRKFITSSVFADEDCETDFVSIFVKPFGYEVRISGEGVAGGSAFNVIELLGVFVVGDNEIIDAFLKDFGSCEFRTIEEVELVHKIWQEYEKDINEIINIDGETLVC